MRFLNTRKFVMFIVTIFMMFLMLGTVLAHEGREVGEYRLVVGWRSEPALVGFPNGPELFIRVHEEHEEEGDHEDENPLEGIDVSLQVEVAFGPTSRTLDMRQDFRDPTHFIANLIPTRPGDYSFRIFGMIGDMEIDEVFSSADGSYSSAEPAGDVTFPDELPSIIDLLERISELEAQVEALQNGE